MFSIGVRSSTQRCIGIARSSDPKEAIRMLQQWYRMHTYTLTNMLTYIDMDVFIRIYQNFRSHVIFLCMLAWVDFAGHEQAPIPAEIPGYDDDLVSLGPDSGFYADAKVHTMIHVHLNSSYTYMFVLYILSRLLLLSLKHNTNLIHILI